MDLDEFLEELLATTQDGTRLTLRGASLEGLLETRAELYALFNCIAAIQLDESNVAEAQDGLEYRA